MIEDMTQEKKASREERIGNKKVLIKDCKYIPYDITVLMLDKMGVGASKYKCTMIAICKKVPKKQHYINGDSKFKTETDDPLENELKLV